MARTRHKKRKSTSQTNKLKRVSARHVRKSITRGQLRVRKTTLEVRRVISLRGRTHLLEAPAPGQPQQAQILLAESTAIRRFKYWIDQQRLRIWFTTGHVYDFFAVPEGIVTTLSRAQSAGRTFHDLIYGHWTGKSPNKQYHPNYNYVRIR